MLFLSLFSFFMLIFLTPLLHAADFYFSSYLKFRGEYNDNVAFSYYNPERDFLTVTSPSLFLNYKSERFSYSSEFGLDIYDYMDKNRLDTVNQNYKIKINYKWLDRWQISGEGYIIKDTTLQSELKETGIIHFREKRRRYYMAGSLTYLFSQITSLKIQATSSRTEYDWRYNVDYDLLSFSATLQRSLKNQRDVLMSKFYYTNIDSSSSRVDNYGVMLGWQRALSSHSGFTFLAGMRYTKTLYYLYYIQLVPLPSWPYVGFQIRKRRTSTHESGYVTDISLFYRKERSIYRLGFNKNLAYSSYGESVDRSHFYGTFSYYLTPRWTFLFSISYYFTSSSGKTYKEDNIFYSFRPSLKYYLTRRWSLSMFYEYSDYRDKVRDHEYDRHRIWLTLTFEFGKPPAYKSGI
ncbi:hypothetical protein [Thermosulfurimonas sp. F29]|uniref:hypothetical protein n=1 Tax=Thermosulfurimonas sp. F29 TaxID=2867247 RepID=UPI001C828B2B|nr:hypothetical protein [Thermosulfurimonas sp. F29]MBX6421985.1 hypothetical protein [Thermosulfurimonas sp. F29]